MVLLTFLLFFPEASKANHIIASGMSWECLGNDQYKITVTIYRDCTGDPMDTVYLNSQCNTTGAIISKKPASPGTGIDVTPVCDTQKKCTQCTASDCYIPYGIQKYTFTYFTDYKNVPNNCCKIRLSLDQCCMTTSLSDALLRGKTFYTEAILDRCVIPCNNSPRFTNDPVGLYCVGQDIIYTHGVIHNDRDTSGKKLDQLKFNFSPLLLAHDSFATHSGKYTFQKPFNYLGFPRDFSTPPRGFHLDTLTGRLQFRPMKAENGIMAIAVKEYRNGKLVGKVRREMYFRIINCNLNNPPDLSGINGNRQFRTSLCAGDSISFKIQSSDKDSGDSLQLRFYPGNLPGQYTWTDNQDTAQFPTGTFKFKPQKNYTRETAYTFSVTARDNHCPVNGRTARSYTIKINPLPKAKISTRTSSCGIVNFSATPYQGSGIGYSWRGTGDLQSNFKVFSHQYPRPGDFPYSLKLEAKGCSYTHHDTIHLDPFLYVNAGNDTTVCKGDTLTLHGKARHNTGQVNYFWTTGSKQPQTTLSGINKDSQDIYLNVSDDNCSFTDHIKIKTLGPSADAGKDTSICGNIPPVRLNGVPGGGKWSGQGIIQSNRFDPGKVTPNKYYTLSYNVREHFTCRGKIRTVDLSDQRSIYVKSYPVAGFTASPRYGNYPLLVNFNDKTQGVISSWNWNFGVSPSQNSTKQNPWYYYKKPGKYTVMLIVTQYNKCSDILVKENLIHAWNPISIEETPNDLKGRIHPNPGKGSVEIYFPGNLQKPLQVQVFSKDGKQVRSFRQVDVSALKIRRKHLGPGTYILLVKDLKGKVVYGKFQFE